MKLFWMSMALLMALAGNVRAADDVSKVKAGLNKVLPGAKADSIEKSAIPGFYEVVFGGEIYYVSADGRFLMAGSVLDLEQNGKNLTEARRAQGRLAVLKKIDYNTAITFSPKETKYSLTVFTDVDCGYCRRLHAEMDELNKRGIEVRYLFHPNAGKGSRSYEKAESVWCGKDQQRLMTDAKAGKIPPQKTCDHPIDTHMALAAELGISGTPSMVLSDGTVIPGYVPAERLEALLAEHAK